MQIRREGTEAAYWLRGAICPDSSHVHGRSDVDGSRVRVHHRHLTAVPRLRSFGVHLQFLLTAARYEISQVPVRSLCTSRQGVSTSPSVHPPEPTTQFEGEQLFGYREAERLGGRQVNDQIKLGRLLDWNVAGLGSA